MTQPVEQLTQVTGLIATASAAANFGQHTASMRLPPTTHSRKSTHLTMNVIGTTRVNRFTDLAMTMIPCIRSGMIAKEESPSARETAASTSTTLNDLSREPMTCGGPKHTSDITGIHIAIHLTKDPHVLYLIVIGSTETKLSLRRTVRTVREAASALLQTGCAVDRTIPTASAPTATDLTNSRQDVLIREVKLRARESKSQATVLTARAAFRTGTGRMRTPKRKIFGMCAED